MLRIGLFSFQWPDDATLEISVANSAHVPSLEPLGFKNGAEVRGSIETTRQESSCLAYSEDKDGLFEPVRLLEETNYEIIISVPYSLSEALRIRDRSGIRHWPFVNSGLAPHVQILSPRLWKQDTSGRRTLVSAFFNAKGYAGVVDLSILDSRHRLAVEVVSAKIGYENEFKQMLADVAENHIQLVYEIGAVSRIRLHSTSEQRPDLPTALFHLRRLMSSDELPSALETILAAPLETLISIETSESGRGSSQPDASFLSARVSQMSFKPGGALSGLFQGFTPVRIPLRTKRQSFDNGENRYIKGFLYGLAELLVTLHEACIADERWIPSEEVGRWLDNVYEWMDNSVWVGVGDLSLMPENSQRLQKCTGYRDVLRGDIELRGALELPWNQATELIDSALGDVKPVATLYEYWCYFTIRNMLKALYGPDTTGAKAILSQSAGKLSMRLTESSGGPGAIFRDGLPEGTTIHLFFNRRFRPKPEDDWGKWSGTYSVSFDPDISIAVKTSPVTHWLNFDAKYRLERFQWEDAAQEAVSGSSSPSRRQSYRQDDLNKMHCYRDAILGTRGAYVLYPGQSDEAESPFLRRAETPRRGFSFPSVGAFALRPGSVEQLLQLKTFIRDTVSKLLDGQAYQEEEGFADTTTS